MWNQIIGGVRVPGRVPDVGLEGIRLNFNGFPKVVHKMRYFERAAWLQSLFPGLYSEDPKPRSRAPYLMLEEGLAMPA